MTTNGTLVSFGDVVRHRAESTSDPIADGLSRLVGLEHLEPGLPFLRRWSTMPSETSFSRTFRSGQVLFAKRRAYQRKAALAAFHGVCSGDLLVFEADSEHLLPEVLPFLVQSDAFIQYAEQTSAGSMSPRTKWKDVARFEFVLPSLVEQRRIGVLLQAALRDMMAAERALEAARVARAVMSSEYFERQLAEGDTLRLDEVLLTSQYGLSVKATPTGRVPILGMGQMVAGRMVTEGASFVMLSDDECDGYQLRPDDILFNRTNSVEHVGRVALNDLRIEAVFASYLIRLVANDKRLLASSCG